MENARCLLIFLGILLLAPLAFVTAYILWSSNHLAAILVLFFGLSVDILGGFSILDRTLSHA